MWSAAARFVSGYGGPQLRSTRRHDSADDRGNDRGYVARFTGHAANIAAEEIEPIRDVMREAGKRRWKHLAEERIENVTPAIPLGRKY